MRLSVCSASPLLCSLPDLKCRIIDAAIAPDWEARVLREVQDALCLGISVLTGPMIRGAIRISKLVKKQNPSLPIIFGGWHPSLVPGQTLNEPYVDAVVRGQGELTLLAIAERLAEKKEFHDVQGVSSKPCGVRATFSRTPHDVAGRSAARSFPSDRFRRLRAHLRRPEARLRDERGLPLRLQLLHGHGVLQAPVQRACD